MNVSSPIPVQALTKLKTKIRQMLTEAVTLTTTSQTTTSINPSTTSQRSRVRVRWNFTTCPPLFPTSPLWHYDPLSRIPTVLTMATFLEVGGSGISVDRYSDYFPNGARPSEQHGTLTWQVPGTDSVLHLRIRAAYSITVVRPYCVARPGFRVKQVILQDIVHAV